jgi:DNA-binding winged helix-turn-helix (wHTH) protein
MSDVTLDPANFDVYIDGDVLEPILSPRQWTLLHLLWDNRNLVVSRNRIVDVVWPDANGVVTDQAIDALAQRLRRRLAEATQAEVIRTVRARGFKFVDGARA